MLKVSGITVTSLSFFCLNNFQREEKNTKIGSVPAYTDKHTTKGWFQDSANTTSLIIISKMLYCHVNCWEPLFIKEKLIVLSEVNFLCKLNFIRNLCFITKKRKLRMLNLRSLVSNCWLLMSVHTQYTFNFPKIYANPHQVLNFMEPMKYCSINSHYIAKVICNNLLCELDLVTQISIENCMKVCMY